MCQPTAILSASHPHNHAPNSCNGISIDSSAVRCNTLPNNLIPMVPLSALTNIDGQHHAMAQRCCFPQVSSTSSHGPNIIHAPPHAPICSMGPLINRGQLHHCVSDGNNVGVTSVDGGFTAQHQVSHSNQQPGVMLVQYPKLPKSSIVSESSADTIHPQGPLPPTPIDRDSSVAEEQTPYLMELPSRPASAGAAAIQVASSLGMDTGGYPNHVNQRQQHFSTFFHPQMDPTLSTQQGAPTASSIGHLPAGNSASNSIKRESNGSRRSSQLRKQQSISCAYEYCDDKIRPNKHQPHLQSINDLDG